MDETADKRYAAVVQMRIREARLNLGLRQTDVAGLIGIDVREYQRLERSSSGKRFNPTLFTFRALGQALQMDPGELIKEPSAEELEQADAPYESRVDRQD